MAIRITCIVKPAGRYNAHEAIIELGWRDEASGRTGRISRLDLWQWLTDKKGAAYVKDSKGDVVGVYPATNERGTKYVRTRADGIWTDNLLSLPECSVQ